MEIRIRDTGEVMSESQFRSYQKSNDGPSWDETTTEVLELLGADVVFEGPQASGGDQYQYSMRQGVEQVDGKWYTKYVLGPTFTDLPASGDQPAMTASDQEAAYKAQKDAEQATSIRAERDRKLAECDWVILKAVDASADGLGIQLPLVWINYRKALRDVPSQDGFPWNVIWPTKPE